MPLDPQLRLHRLLLLYTGAAYLGWWFFVHAALPNAFNPFGGRAAVVACFGIVFGASHVSKAVARNLPDWLAGCACLATAHYFYLFDRNDGDLNWVVGSYITVMVVCAVLQTSRSLLLYSGFVALVSVALLFRPSGRSYIVFFPGMLTGLVFANVGLQSRLRLLARLNESHARVESLFDAGFDGIAVHEGGVVRQVNGVIGPLLGCAKEELIGKDVTSLFVPEDKGRVAEIVAGRDDGPAELEALKKDGSRFAVEVLAKRHVLGGRKMQQLAFRDLTERKRAEAAMLAANRDLEAFSYSVAHDLRSPLRAINGFSRIVLDEYAAKMDDDGKKHLERIASGAETMGLLIDALLELARVSRTELRRQTVDLSKLAADAAHALREATPDRAVELVFEEGVVVEGDPALLRALIVNLISNAWKFSGRREAPRVAFGTTVRDGALVYFVRDNGIGFDMAYASKLFRPFQRLHDATQYPGTGIGLATVQRIVDRHRGRVWTEAALDEGATFYFTLS